MKNNELIKRSLSLMVAGTLLTLSSPVVFAATMQDSGTGTNMNTQTMTQTGPAGVTETQSTYSTSQSAVIPAGTSLMVRPTGALPTTIGSNVTAQVVSPVMVNGMTVIPTGSQVNGTVVGVNNSDQTVDLQFRDVSLTSGEDIPIRSSATVSQIAGSVQQTSTPMLRAEQGASTLFPRITYGREATTPGGRILAGTAGGAAFGATTGALSGLISTAVYRHDINYSEGTGALRGAAWGAATGAGLGLVTGLLAAGVDRHRTSVTSTSVSARPMHPLTNISTGSLEEVPVSYQAGGTAATGVNDTSTFNIILQDPITVTQ